MSGQVVLNRLLQILHAGMCLALDPLLAQRREEALHQIQPGCRSRCEMHLVARMRCQPRFHHVGLVCRVVVHYQMNRHVLWYVGVDLFEEGKKLRISMAALQSSDDFTRRDVQRREQRCGSVALVLVGASDGFAGDKR